MKRNFLFLIGFFTVALVAVIFIACEKSESKSGHDNSLIVGTWKYDIEREYGEDAWSIVITFNKDNTGKIKEKYWEYTTNITFAYTYDSKNDILKMDVDNVDEYEDFFSDFVDTYSSLIRYHIEWIGDNRFYAHELFDGYEYYDDYKIGPFIRQ